ncbi:isoaspartyl peptidase/L-asparaginase [Segetibacter sp.]|jgi:beta-aspartyl-peptidase (threonine type)|uniref:isoaspartyl peptidase/L-asparaginase family protein n=1 Tax=Segetibacter sp. TaxID=2231182 RepID=UPI002621E635|nr:isoaspartyl peptidase/L-asparaginase [Segetibacter sp.]MCW3078951.1 asparaginase [Segetibacter sp.]
MGKLTILVHGGAGPDSAFIKKNIDSYKQGLREAADTGYGILEAGGTAMDAVEAAVNYLEDNPLFNSGRGSALNEKAEVEMDASIMDGKTMKSGAVAIVKNVKNPVTLARAIMEKTKHIYIGDMGALEFAQKMHLRLMPEAYFITDHAYEQYLSATEEEANSIEQAGEYQVRRKEHGTVGAVAVDKDGNVAAATSTGGTENKVPGRIGDSSIIGIGSYANNKTCAVSSTGDGEVLIRNVAAFHVSAIMQYKGLNLKEACNYLIKEELKDAQGDMGIIAVDPEGNFTFEFNSERMHRAWRTSDGEQGVGIYKE